jgi:hypothetical protein
VEYHNAYHLVNEKLPERILYQILKMEQVT